MKPIDFNDRIHDTRRELNVQLNSKSYFWKGVSFESQHRFDTKKYTAVKIEIKQDTIQYHQLLCTLHNTDNTQLTTSPDQ